MYFVFPFQLILTWLKQLYIIICEKMNVLVFRIFRHIIDNDVFFSIEIYLNVLKRFFGLSVSLWVGIALISFIDL